MTNNIAKVQLTNTFDYQRNRINDAIDVINNMRDGILEVNSEANLPAPASAPSNIYLIKNHTKYKGAVLALLNGSSYTMVPLKNDPINSNAFIYSTAGSLGTGVAVNKFVYLDGNKVWQLADCTDNSKKALGIVGPYNAIILSGIVQSAGLSLTPGATYYYDNTGSLTTTPTLGYAGIALDTTVLDVNIREKTQFPQSDWNQSDTTADDYIKNKPGTVSKQADGFVPQLPDENTVTKFFRQDGSWAVPSYPTDYIHTNGGAVMTYTGDAVSTPQVRNISAGTTIPSTQNAGDVFLLIS
jgi:hypothetical protein